MPTKSGSEFEVMFRAYAPTKAFFDKTWQLPDIEKIAAKVDPKAGSAGRQKRGAIDDFGHIAGHGRQFCAPNLIFI